MAHGTPAHKVILCGEYGVGKSSIFRRFVDNSFTEDTGPRSTIGLDHFGKDFTVHGHKTRKLVLWDTAGIERFATLSSSYFQSASAAILCYSLENRESFSMLSQHLLDTAMHMQTGKIFLCGNKCDVQSEEPITDGDIIDFQNQCDSVLDKTFKVSCKTGEGIRAMFQDIADIIQKDAEERFDPSRIQPHNSPQPTQTDKQCCKSS